MYNAPNSASTCIIGMANSVSGHGAGGNTAVNVYTTAQGFMSAVRLAGVVPVTTPWRL